MMENYKLHSATALRVWLQQFVDVDLKLLCVLLTSVTFSFIRVICPVGGVLQAFCLGFDGQQRHLVAFLKNTQIYKYEWSKYIIGSQVCLKPAVS